MSAPPAVNPRPSVGGAPIREVGGRLPTSLLWALGRVLWLLAGWVTGGLAWLAGAIIWVVVAAAQIGLRRMADPKCCRRAGPTCSVVRPVTVEAYIDNPIYTR